MIPKKSLQKHVALALALMLLIVNTASAPMGGVNVNSNAVTIPYPILFVTQVPIAPGFTTIASTFGNHRGATASAGRGGDLYILYPDGTLKNLTAAAGYGGSGFVTGNQAIAVRDPSVYWDGTKALFSMVIGAPSSQYLTENYYWQIYEITGLGKNETPVITQVPNQPQNFNNISPIYGSDDRIIFTSDRPRNGSSLLYPQLDEYELAPTVSGLWSLEPNSGDLKLLNHAPSGDFTPIIDSYGRIVFTQWDHLQRDQLADADQENTHPGTTNCGDTKYGTFNYESETSAEYNLNVRTEIFPEPRACRTDLLNGTNSMGHSFNQFFPWSINQDGSEGEIISHLGRHEFGVYIEKAIKNDPSVIEYFEQYGNVDNNNDINTGVFQIEEDPNNPGDYIGIDAPEFGTHASGNIVRINAPLGLNADHVIVDYLTHPDTYGTTSTADHSGHYRDPLILSDGTFIAVHSPYQGEDSGTGFNSDYTFRLKSLTLNGNGYYVSDQYLTGGISKTISYWSPDSKIIYTGLMWELSPVEVRPRTRPTASTSSLGNPEQQIFTETGVNPNEFMAWMKQNNLALAVGRNVTTRDDMDKQQPFNLHIPNGTQTTGNGGKLYDVNFLQMFQADQLRGLTGCCGSDPFPGRRVLAQIMHDAIATTANPTHSGPAGSTPLAADGSFAVFVPAQRAMTWQLTDQNGNGVVRERYWVTFQPGEIRVCASCHGINELDQAGDPAPTNPPEALRDLLEYWKAASQSTFADVSGTHWASSWIERLYAAGITGGCGSNPLIYCPENPVTRAQMAVFLEKGLHGSGIVPPNINATFTDTSGHWAEDWIEALKNDGITSGCGTGIYCPENTVTRAQMAVFLLKSTHGASYSPPPATGTFSDVSADHWAAAWIEQLAAEGITSGCGSGIYCPENPVTRAQMAVFLVKAFNLP
ncbi:MAG TPA: S-layer homology domain-containing protein [Anaerolineales bacterium]|nr:S-layer homology domain-containing protein [Anaerolineales bacterium]